MFAVEGNGKSAALVKVRLGESGELRIFSLDDDAGRALTGDTTGPCRADTGAETVCERSGSAKVRGLNEVWAEGGSRAASGGGVFVEID